MNHMPTDFITVDYLATFAGLVLVLGIIVQFTKGIVKHTFTDQAVRLYTFAWALVLIGLLYWYQGMFDVAAREIAMTLLLALLNAIIVTLAAMGGYEVITDPGAAKRKPE
jgi:hypothetical protein